MPFLLCVLVAMSVFGFTVDSNEKQVLQRTMAEIVAIPEVSAACYFKTAVYICTSLQSKPIKHFYSPETFKLHCTTTLQTASHDMWALMQPSIPNTPKYLLCTTSFKQHFNKHNNIQLTK